MREYAETPRGQAVWYVSRALSLPPSEVVRSLGEGDPEMAFSVAAEVERFDAEMKLWEAHFDHLQAIQKTIANAFGK